MKIKHVPVFLSLSLLAACGGSNEHSTEATHEAAETVAAVDSSKDVESYNIPSPFETFAVLKLANASFDKTILNPVDRVTKYSSNFSKAVNLGVYSADMSYCFMHKQNQEFNNYLKNVNSLTNSLGIDGSYGEGTAKRLQANANNLDSLMQISTEASLYADSYLKENQRQNTTVAVAFGAWMEGFHIMTSVANKKPSEIVNGLITDQKTVIKNMIKMLEQFPNDNEMNGLLTDIKDIQTIFDGLKAIEHKTEGHEKEAIVSVGNNTSFELSKEQLKALTEKITALRNKLTN